MLLGNGMIHATDAALYERPETFDGVGVNVSAYVDALGVLNPFVLVSRLIQDVVNSQLVCVDGILWQHTFNHVRHDASAGCVFYRNRDYFSAALNNSEH